MTFASVLSGGRSSRVLAVMPMMISISVMVVTVFAIAVSRRGPALVRVFEMRRVHALGRMGTRLMIFESVDVAKFFAAVGLRTLEILSAGRRCRLGTLA